MRVYIELLRPLHWIKNLAVLVVLPFGLLTWGTACIVPALGAFGAFCLAASGVYALNDVLDRHNDQAHPLKRNRPIPRGAVSVAEATGLAFVCAAASLAVAVLSYGPILAALVGGYILLMAWYSLSLKHVAILDVIVIASGFVIRASAGAVAVNVTVSPWLMICTFTLCLFLGFGKRRSELTALRNRSEVTDHRPSLQLYSPELLTQLLSTSAGITLVTFLLYIMDQDIKTVYDKSPLLYTFPLVAYGVFRYAMMIGTENVCGPTELISRDRTLLIVIGLWMLTSTAIILFEPLRDATRSWWPKETEHESFNRRNPSHLTPDRAAGLSSPDESGRLSPGHRPCNGHSAEGQHQLAFLLPGLLDDTLATRRGHSHAAARRL
jgi:4-hydroxybenzoate polyprenyltransferase